MSRPEQIYFTFKYILPAEYKVIHAIPFADNDKNSVLAMCSIVETQLYNYLLGLPSHETEGSYATYDVVEAKFTKESRLI